MSSASGAAASTWPRVVSALVAVVAALVVHATWAVFVNTAAGQSIDRAAFESAQFHQSQFGAFSSAVLSAISYSLIAVGLVVAIIIAVVRRRWPLALQAVILVAGANMTTQLLKDYYPRPNLLAGWTGQNSLPSGHVTAAASVAVALLLTVPRRWRGFVAVVGVFWTTAIGLATLIRQWHRPADIVAALFVVCAWGAGVCVASNLSSRDQVLHPETPLLTSGRPFPVTSIVMGVLALLAGGAAVFISTRLWLEPNLLSSATNTAFWGGVGAIVASVSGSFGTLLWLRQATLNPITARGTPNDS